MTNTKILLKALLGATALTVFTTGTAQAQNNFTPADTTVSNTFTLDYNVGGVPQPQITPPAPTDFVVDRLIDLTVADEFNATTVPDASDVEVVFSVTNNGNDEQGYALFFEEDPANPFDTETPASALPELAYYIDTTGTAAYDDTIATTAYNELDPPELMPDEVLWVVVTQDIAADAVDGETSDVVLLAQTLVPNTPADDTANYIETSDSSNVIGTVQNVLIDEAGDDSTDAANDGAHSATASYIIASADVAGTKTVSTITDVLGSPNCALIPGPVPRDGGFNTPGACVEYVIEVTNDGSAPATDIEVGDLLPPYLTYIAADVSDLGTGFTLTEPSNADCSVVPNPCQVTVTGGVLAAGDTTQTSGRLIIRALIQ